MNYKFRKKPVVIEAFQMTQARREDNSDWPDWLNKAWNEDPFVDGAMFINDLDIDRELECDLSINTPEGELHITYGDYIIQGVNGELYPCKPEIFEKTYDEVVE